MAPEKADLRKKPPAEEEDEEDNVPIALSRSKHANGRTPPKRDAEEEDEDDRSLGARSKSTKKKAGTPNGIVPVNVKKEEDEGGESGKKGTKEMVSNKTEDRKGKNGPVKVKKEEPSGEVSSEEEEDDKKKKMKKMIKKKIVENNKKAVKKVAKVTIKGGKKKEKKVYDLPGQKHDTPEERDPLRIFYETLYQQVPNSEMAQYWMMEFGLLPLEIAEKIYAKKLKNRGQSLSSPVKAVPAKKTAPMKKVNQISAGTGRPNSKTPAKRKIRPTTSDEEEDDNDDDFMSSLKKKPKKQKISH